MANALVLQADGKRKNGRWDYGEVANSEDLHRSSMKKALAQAGVVLDHAPDLAAAVVSGDLALDAAYRQAGGVPRRLVSTVTKRRST